MTRLIVTADDLGLDRGMNDGVLRAHREGIVTACSLVATGRAFDDAVARLRDAPALEVGVHLALVEEASLTRIALPRGYASFVPRYLLRTLGIAQIERELRAQLERVLATGLRVTHLNGHQHLHVLPRIFDVVVRLAQEHAIRYVRTIDDRGGRAPLARRIPVAALSSLGRRARTRAREAGLRTCDRTIGVTEAGHLTVDRLIALLDHVEGLTELVTHPALGSPAYTWGYAWEQETHALCDPRLREAMQKRSVQLVTPATC